MKGAPNWKGPSDDVTGVWKEDLIRWAGRTLGLKKLIETGTCEGSTLKAVEMQFDYIYSVELSDHYYEVSKKRLLEFPHIKLWHGTSIVCLPEMIEIANKESAGPILFWLDAHPCGGPSANLGDPLPMEIKIIEELAPDSLVIIDDLKSADLDHVPLLSDRWVKEYRTGVIIMSLDGRFKLPAFEE
jgi:hypothetical protein